MSDEGNDANDALPAVADWVTSPDDLIEADGKQFVAELVVRGALGGHVDELRKRFPYERQRGKRWYEWEPVARAIAQRRAALNEEWERGQG